MFSHLGPNGAHAGLKRRDWLLIGACWLALAAFHLAFAHVGDVDDTVRLIQVRALLEGQDWFDLTLRRIAPPEGVPMHWSRLVDLPIAGAILVARIFVDSGQAERFALAAVPLLTLGCVAALLYRAALRLTGARVVAVTAVLLGCTSAALFGQLNPGRIDHHGWQIVAALVALNGLLAGRPRTGGAVIGAALALWLAISIEGLPLTAAFLAVLGLRWLHDPEQRAWLVSAAATLALVSLFLWLATHRLDAGALTPWCDVVTPVHLAMFVWTAIGTGAVALLPPGGRGRDLILLGGVALGGLAIFALGAPQCLGGGYDTVDPLVERYWLANVGEAMPLWTRPFALVVSGALPVFLGLAVLAGLAWRARAHAVLWSYLLVLAAATALGCLIIRSLGVTMALAVPPLAWALVAGIQAMTAEPRTRVRLAGWLILFTALAPWIVQFALLVAIRAEAGEANRHCNLASRAAELNALSRATFLAPFDLGPELLPATGHSILASGHHRATAAMHDQLAALLGTTAAAREIVVRRGIGYVAVCADSAEVRQYRKVEPDSFVSRLARGEVPGWLVQVPISGPDAPMVWRVDLPATDRAASARQSPSP